MKKMGIILACILLLTACDSKAEKDKIYYMNFIFEDYTVKARMYDTEEEAKKKSIGVRREYESFEIEETGEIIYVDEMPEEFYVRFKGKYICLQKWGK